MKIPQRIAIRAWEFVATMEDASPRVVLRVEPPLRLCEHGLHGWETMVDALQHASGSILCRTRHWGEVHRGSHGLCSSRRKTMWALDVSGVLHRFAVAVAADAVKTHCRIADPRCLWAIDAKCQWIAGCVDVDALKAIRHSAADLVERTSKRFPYRSPEWYAAKSSAAAAMPTAHEAAAGAFWAAAWADAEASIVDLDIPNEPAAWHANMRASIRRKNRLLEQMVAEYRQPLR